MPANGRMGEAGLNRDGWTVGDGLEHKPRKLRKIPVETPLHRAVFRVTQLESKEPVALILM